MWNGCRCTASGEKHALIFQSVCLPMRPNDAPQGSKSFAETARVLSFLGFVARFVMSFFHRSAPEVPYHNLMFDASRALSQGVR